MAIKTVVVEAVMGEGFKAESKLGSHTVYVDQPEAMGGTDAGPNPLQYLLLSLAGCFCAIARIVAKQKKLTVRSVKVKVQGDLNMDVLLGISKDDRAGFGALDVEIEVDADMTLEEKEAYVHEVDSRCPVSDNIMKTTSISVKLK